MHKVFCFGFVFVFLSTGVLVQGIITNVKSFARHLFEGVIMKDW